MANHFLQQLVDGVAAMLTTPAAIPSLSGVDKVFKDDDYPRDESLGKWVNVYTNGFQRETRGPGTGARPEVQNMIDTRVQCVAKASSGSARAAVIQMAKEVEERWFASNDSERLKAYMPTKPLFRARITDVDVRVDTDADGAFAVAEMTVQVLVLSTEGRPDLT